MSGISDIDRERARALGAAATGGFEASPGQQAIRVGGGSITFPTERTVWDRDPSGYEPVSRQVPWFSDPQDVGRSLDAFYKTQKTSQDVRDWNVGSWADQSKESAQYWGAKLTDNPIRALDEIYGRASGEITTPLEPYLPKYYTSPNFSGPMSDRNWITPPSKNWVAPGIEGTVIKQPDGRQDDYRPGVGYSGSTFEGNSLKTARELYERQGPGGVVKLPDTYYAVEGQKPAPRQVPIPERRGGGWGGMADWYGSPPTRTVQDPTPRETVRVNGGMAIAPKGPMPDNVNRVITSPSGQVIGWARQWESPEAAQAASNAAKAAAATASANKPKTASAAKAA